MNHELLSTIKTKLLGEEQRIAGLLERTHAHIHRSEPVSADFAEQAIDTENDVVVEALDREGHIELQQIRHALKRIEDGSYGLCGKCGAQIQEARLMTIPETELCIVCASQSE